MGIETLILALIVIILFLFMIILVYAIGTIFYDLLIQPYLRRKARRELWAKIRIDMKKQMEEYKKMTPEQRKRDPRYNRYGGY